MKFIKIFLSFVSNIFSFVFRLTIEMQIKRIIDIIIIIIDQCNFCQTKTRFVRTIMYDQPNNYER